VPKKINTKPIKYTSRDFDSIKEELVDYAKRYYPDTFKDFNKASFGSLMLDTVAYVGDILSFYLDYQASESFLQSSIEYNNILKHGRQMGFKFSSNPSSYGIISLYLLVPANTTGLGPDIDYIPILKKGATFTSEGGGSFILNDDVDFAKDSNEVRVGRVDSITGIPSYYAIKAYGQVVSGRTVRETQEVGSFEKFLKLILSTQDVTEIVSVIDSEGNQYYETEYLSQDIIYKGITNQIKEDRDKGAVQVLKPFTVPRRFVIERDRRTTYLQFGASSDIKINDDMIADPASVILQVHGKNYISDTSFDPTNLIESDKFGVSPSNTALTIICRVNDSETVNASAGKLKTVTNAIFSFGDTSSLAAGTISTVQQSLEIENEEPIVGDVSLPTSEELKVRIFDSFATQNRAVTQTDYQALIYRMPPQFGAIKRARVIRDEDSFKRNLNIYMISEDSDGNLVQTNDSIKKNLKTWLQTNKMVNDTIDILDAKIANFGVDFRAVADLESSKFAVLSTAEDRLKTYFNRKLEIGEPIFLTDIYAELKKVDGIVDVISVKIIRKVGGNYSELPLDIEDGMSPDGRYIQIPKNVILELKYPDSDIKGVIV
tara:strand:+ start:5906 stop:7711 length:1806 start_codon:yes stop_codon:yes gene_type:complete